MVACYQLSVNGMSLLRTVIWGTQSFRNVWRDLEICPASSSSGTNGSRPGGVRRAPRAVLGLLISLPETFLLLIRLDKPLSPWECSNQSVLLNTSRLFIECLQKVWQWLQRQTTPCCYQSLLPLLPRTISWECSSPLSNDLESAFVGKLGFLWVNLRVPAQCSFLEAELIPSVHSDSWTYFNVWS